MIIKIQDTSQKQMFINDITYKLQELGYETLTNDSEINFQGRTINLEAFEQIKKRDPNNPHIVELKKISLKNQLEKIEKMDMLLVCNEKHDIISSSVIIDSIISYYKSKPVYFLNIPERSRNIFYDEFIGMEFKYLEGNFKNLFDFLKSINEVLTVKSKKVKLSRK